MKFMLRLRVAICLVFAFASAPALAGPPEFVADGARSIAGGRALQVIVAQAEIQSNINKSMIAQAAGGGMLMALIDASVEQARAKKAEAAITPLREALAGFDADALAQVTTGAIVDATPWLQPVSVGFGKDSSVVGKSSYLDAAGAEQVAFFEYSYDVSASFDAVRVKLLVQFANRALPETKGKAPKPESRVGDRYLAYSQTITAIVSLPSPSEEIEPNVPRWSADNAALARTALTEAFQQVQRFAPRALALTEPDLKAMKGKDRKRMALGGFQGRQQPDAEPGTLIWGDEGFAYAQTMELVEPAATAEQPADGQPAGGQPADAQPTVPADSAPADAAYDSAEADAPTAQQSADAVMPDAAQTGSPAPDTSSAGPAPEPPRPPAP